MAFDNRITSTEGKDAVYAAHVSKSAIENIGVKGFENLLSDYSEIDAIANVINPKLAEIHKIFREAANGVNNNVTYAVVGDSTRNNSFNKMIDYYTEQLTKINVSLFNNAASGQSGYEWAYNIDQTTLQQLIDEIGDNDSDFVVEFSHGINDYKNGATQEDVKTWLTYGLNQLLLAKPNVNIILCTPVITANTGRNAVLKTIYEELATEFNLPLIDCTLATEYGVIQGNENYYQDTTHPNKYGSRRIVDYIFNIILPLELLSIVTIQPYDKSLDIDDTDLNPVIKDNYFYVSTSGNGASSTDWACLEIIPVEPNFTVMVKHGGNRNDQIYKDINNTFIKNDSPTVTDGVRYTVVPINAYDLRINLSNEPSYDPSLDTIEVKYYDPSLNIYLTIEDIHLGLNIRNVLNKFRDGILVDDFGRVGTSGQTLTIDANNKMKWA